MAAMPIQTRRWRRIEYERLVDQGVFQPGEHVELVAGQLVVREPQGTSHMTAIRMAEDVLRRVFGAGWEVRTQAPVALDDESEPEPDIVVAPGHVRDYRYEHPSRPALLVEVADTSLAFDREHKASLYARARVPDYWIINLVERVLEVHREPVEAAGTPYGWAYRLVRSVDATHRLSPLAVPHATILVADLLP